MCNEDPDTRRIIVFPPGAFYFGNKVSRSLAGIIAAWRTVEGEGKLREGPNVTRVGSKVRRNSAFIINVRVSEVTRARASATRNPAAPNNPLPRAPSRRSTRARCYSEINCGGQSGIAPRRCGFTG